MLELNLKKFGILFILGAVLAPIGDIVHVLSKTTQYPSEFSHLFKIIPWWVPLQFGIATIIIGFAHHKMNRLRKLSLKTCCLSAASLMSSYIISGLLPGQPWLSCGVILLLFFYNFRQLNDEPTSTNMDLAHFNNRYLLLNSLIIALIGSTIEMVLISNGVFQYNQYQLISVPLWLPILYMHASLTVGTFTNYLENTL